MEYRIGDFAVITRLTIKSLRNYHEMGLLIPTRIDNETGYRIYDESLIPRTGMIRTMKEWNFSLQEIREILDSYEEDGEIIDIIRNKRQEIQEKIKSLKRIENDLTLLLAAEKETDQMNIKEEITIRETKEMKILSITYRGRFDECGKYIGKLYKAAGAGATGKVFCQYGENMDHSDPEISVCLQVRKEMQAAGMEYRVLPPRRVLSLIHKGPYTTLGSSYKKLINRREAEGLKQSAPYREIYLKGPGMLFPGNPEKYITEIQLPVE